MLQAIARNIAVMRRFQPCRPAAALLDDLPVEIDFLDPLADLSVEQDGGRIGIVEHERGMRRTAPQTLLDPRRHKRTGQLRPAAIDDDALVPVRKFERQRGCTPLARMARLGRRRGVHHEDTFARLDALITPLARFQHRPRAHLAGSYQSIDCRFIDGRAALPTTQPLVAHPQGQQRRDQPVEQSLDRRGRIAFHRGIAGTKIDKQRDRLHLCRRAARHHPAVFADQLAKRFQQASFAVQAARPAIGHEQSGGDNRGPSGDLRELILALRHIAIEPAGGRFDRFEKAILEAFPLARKQHRRVHQPVEQAQSRQFDVPRRTFAVSGILLDPCAEDAPRGIGALAARRRGRKIAHPRETMHGAREGRREFGRRGEVQLADRRFQAAYLEIACAKGNAGGTIAGQRGLDHRHKAFPRRFPQRCGQDRTRYTQLVGPADGRIERAGTG